MMRRALLALVLLGGATADDLGKCKTSRGHMRLYNAKCWKHCDCLSFNCVKGYCATAHPTGSPSSSPTSNPTASPTANPTSTPSISPTNAPTTNPTAAPTGAPTVRKCWGECCETLSVAHDLAGVVNGMKRRLENRGCASGFTENHLGRCVLIGQKRVIGVVPTAAKRVPGYVDKTTGKQFVDPSRTFSKPGKIVSWDMYTLANGTTALQVWRKIPGKSDYKTVCQNLFTSSKSGRQHFDVHPAQQCHVQANDLVGWSHSHTGILEYVTNTGKKLLYRDSPRYTINRAYGFSRVLGREYYVSATVTDY